MPTTKLRPAQSIRVWKASGRCARASASVPRSSTAALQVRRDRLAEPLGPAFHQHRRAHAEGMARRQPVPCHPQAKRQAGLVAAQRLALLGQHAVVGGVAQFHHGLTLARHPAGQLQTAADCQLLWRAGRHAAAGHAEQDQGGKSARVASHRQHSSKGDHADEPNCPSGASLAWIPWHSGSSRCPSRGPRGTASSTSPT